MMEFRWRVPNELPKLQDFHECLRQGLMEAGCSVEAVQDLELATEELLVNTIRYGYDEGQDSEIEVSAWADAKQVRMVLRDNGRAFDPLEAEPRPEDKCGGWGIPLIKNLMDEFRYERVDGFNQISLLRRQKTEEAP